MGKGRIICASVFCGPDIDFGNGPRLFIDNFGRNSDNIMLFKQYLEDKQYKKVWHNYGFDRHLFYNHGINVMGFGGDTMHMARLQDSSRGPKEYSLASLSKSLNFDINVFKNSLITHLNKKFSDDNHRMNCLEIYKKEFLENNIKTNMKKLFARPRVLKNGTIGKTFEYPSIIEMHTDEKLIKDWVIYSTLDAEITYFIREVLAIKLSKLSIKHENMNNLLDFYYKYWLDFGEMLTDLERNGIKIDIEYLKEIQKKAEDHLMCCKLQFLEWVKTTQNHPYINEFNPNSSQQLQQLFFAPFKRNKKDQIKKEEESESEKDEDSDNEPKVYNTFNIYNPLF